jgi:hypothetical protein
MAGLANLLIGGLIGSQMFGGKEKEEQPRMKGGWSPPNQQQPTQVASNDTQQGQGGGFGGIISGISNSMFKGMSQEQVARLGQGFNSMRLRPDQGMHDAFQNTIKNAQSKINTNATVAELRKMGKPNLARMVEIGAMPVETALTLAFKEGKGTTDIKSMIAWLTGEAQSGVEGREHFAEYAEILTSNPAMLDDISKNVMNDMGFGDDNLAKTYSAPKVMQEGDKAGHEYIIVRDPNKEGSEQISIEYTGAIFPTEIEVEEARVAAEVLAADEQKARDYGALAFNEAMAMDSDIYNYEGALEEFIYVDDMGIEHFKDDHAHTGWIASQLPSIRKSTSKLRTIANKMGISVINMATFGALSEREMKMAMATNLDLNLKKEELVPFIKEMIEAKRKLARVLYDRAYDLNSGTMTYTEWQNQITEKAIIHDDHRFAKLNQAQIKDLQTIIDNNLEYSANGMTPAMLWATYNLDTRIGLLK